MIDSDNHLFSILNCKIKQLILHAQDKLNIFYTLSLISTPNYRGNYVVYVGRRTDAVSLRHSSSDTASMV